MRCAFGQFMGEGYNINGEGVREGSVIRSHLEENKNTAGHSVGQAGLAARVCKGPDTGAHVFLPGAWHGAGTADRAGEASEAEGGRVRTQGW